MYWLAAKFWPLTDGGCGSRTACPFSQRFHALQPSHRTFGRSCPRVVRHPLAPNTVELSLPSPCRRPRFPAGGIVFLRRNCKNKASRFSASAMTAGRTSWLSIQASVCPIWEGMPFSLRSGRNEMEIRAGDHVRVNLAPFIGSVMAAGSQCLVKFWPSTEFTSRCGPSIPVARSSCGCWPVGLKRS